MATPEEAITLSSDSEGEGKSPITVSDQKPITVPDQKSMVDVSATIKENLSPARDVAFKSTSKATSVKITIQSTKSSVGTEKSEPTGEAGEKRVTRSKNTDEAVKRLPKSLRELQVVDQFMEKFDPENSKRERKKLSQKFPSETFQSAPTEPVGPDVCDCFVDGCPGCYFPCPSCKSEKCGPICRINRKLSLTSVVSEATGITQIKPQTLSNTDCQADKL